MRCSLLSQVSALLLVLGTGHAANATAADLGDLVGGDVVKVSGDYKFTEGPAWHPDGYLLFSDIPNNRIVRVNTGGSSSDWVTDSGGANGLMCNQNGDVYAAQGDAARVGLFRATNDGTGEFVKVLAGKYDGKPFNRPNDLALDRQGGLYFTDPNYGRDEAEQPVEGVYYLSPSGEVSRVVDNLPRPNGVLVAEEGQALLVANINERQIMRYEIEAPGKLSPGKAIFTGDQDTDGNGPDGMTLDEQGNIYATYKSLVVLTPQGKLIGRIDVPEKPANCAFGGDDNRTLYITARTSLYSLPMKIAGVPVVQTESSETAQAEEPVETETFEARGLTLQIPKAWESSEPTSTMRLGQFAIPPVEGDDEAAELVVYPPFGGSVAQNVQRWIGQFESEGRQLKMTQGEGKGGRYVLVDLTGTYKKPDGPPFLQKTKPAPNYRMLAVVYSKTGGSNYFLKLTGPKKTVGSVDKQFRQTFGGAIDKEKPYEF